MATKFVSKNSNYMIVLRPGVEGNRALGTQAISGLYINFQDGIVIVPEEEIAEQLRNHKDFGTKFLEVKEEDVDPYISERKGVEPEHITTEIKYGHAGKKVSPPVSKNLSPEMKALLEKEAIRMIPDLIKSNPDILKNALKIVQDDAKEEAKVEDLKIEVEENLTEDIVVEDKKEGINKKQTKKGTKGNK